MAARSDRKQAPPISSSGVCRLFRVATVRITGSSPASTRRPAVWPSGTSRTAGRNHVGRRCLIKAAHAASAAMPLRRRARQRQGDRQCRKVRYVRRSPGRGGENKSIALTESSARRSRAGWIARANCASSKNAWLSSLGSMGWAQQQGVGAAGAVAQHVLQPDPQCGSRQKCRRSSPLNSTPCYEAPRRVPC